MVGHYRELNSMYINSELFHRKNNGEAFPLGNRIIPFMLVKDSGTISHRMFNTVLVNLREDSTQSC